MYRDVVSLSFGISKRTNVNVDVNVNVHLLDWTILDRTVAPEVKAASPRAPLRAMAGKEVQKVDRR